MLITRVNLFSPQNLSEVNPYLSLGLQTKNFVEVFGNVCLTGEGEEGSEKEGQGREGKGKRGSHTRVQYKQSVIV